MIDFDLKKEFEEFIQRQTEQSVDISLAQMLATPYGHQNGTLAAAYHLFQYAFHLGHTAACEEAASEASNA